MAKKLTRIRNVVNPDRDSAYTREACMEMDNLRKDHQRTLDDARRADSKQMTEQAERARYERNRR